MDYETSEEMIPGQALDGESAGEQMPRHATQGYEGFEDLLDDGPWTNGDY